MKLANDPPVKLRGALPRTGSDTFERTSPLLRLGQGDSETLWPGQGEADRPEGAQPVATRWALLLLVMGMLSACGWGMFLAQAVGWVMREMGR